MSIYCPNCGTPNTPQANNCVKCGTALNQVKSGSRFKGTMMMPGINAEELQKEIERSSKSPPPPSPSSPPQSDPTKQPSTPPSKAQEVSQPAEAEATETPSAPEEDQFAIQPTMVMETVSEDDIKTQQHSSERRSHLPPSSTPETAHPNTPVSMQTGGPIHSSQVSEQPSQSNMPIDAPPKKSKTPLFIALGCLGLLLLGGCGVGIWAFMTLSDSAEMYEQLQAPPSSTSP